MMKKLFMIIILSLLFPSCVATEQSEPTVTNETENIIKGVWLYYDEISMIEESGGTAESFKNKIEFIFNKCKQFGLNTVFVQIRPFSDSFYPSEIFPWSKYLTGSQGKSVDYDPLKIMTTCAEKYELRFHAWINPFRISYDNNIQTLCQEHPVFKRNEALIFRCDKGIYYNPANIDAHNLILDGIREIIKNYDVDGIHIDDYFYPVTDEEIDKKQFSDYVNNGGQLTLAQWRTETINAFVSELYTTVKKENPKIIVSISPSGNITNNYEYLFADVIRWSSEKGYCDMIIPQLYYGFDHEKLPFDKCLQQWSEINKIDDIKLVVGIGAYKAVESKNIEWKDYSIIEKQIESALNLPEYDGYCLFSYSSLISLENDVKLTTNAINKE